MKSRVLIAEFLLANSDASRCAAPSMMEEADAMLRAVVADFARLPDVDVTVMLSAYAAARFSEFPLCPAADGRNSILIQRGELEPDRLPSVLRDVSQQVAFDAVLLIAPECDGVLVSLLKAVQESKTSAITSAIRSLNIDWRLAKILADKRTTDAWLRQHSIATIQTRTIDDTIAESLRRTFPQIPARETVTGTERSIIDQLAVLKPRDGAGADSVRVVQFNHRQFQDLPQQCSEHDRWILQPLMPGIACSVGFIGGGEHRPTIILPPARQDIRVTDGEVSYHGGQIPCQSAIASRIAPVAKKVATALGSFHGYVGADLLVDRTVPEDSEGSVRVVEINPRFCTSYVGYRALTEDNLAAWMLQQHTGKALCWKPGAVIFSANGETRFSSTPTI